MNLEDPHVTDLGHRIGFGRVMQAAEAAWSRIASEKGVHGSNHTVGPCAALLVTCPHQEEGGSEKWRDANGHCDWCCGAGRVTERVAQAMRECK
jgi:hypothetical protein